MSYIYNAPRIKRISEIYDLSSIALSNVFQNLSTTIYGETVKHELRFEFSYMTSVLQYFTVK